MDVTKSKLPVSIVAAILVAAAPMAIHYGIERAEATELRAKVEALETRSETERERARREAESLRLEQQRTAQALQYVVEKVGEISQDVKELKRR